LEDKFLDHFRAPASLSIILWCCLISVHLCCLKYLVH
jgi:hypothetical protein